MRRILVASVITVTVMVGAVPSAQGEVFFLPDDGADYREMTLIIAGPSAGTVLCCASRSHWRTRGPEGDQGDGRYPRLIGSTRYPVSSSGPGAL